MKLDAIRQEIIRLVEDKSYDPIALDFKINLALSQCCADVNVPDLKLPFTVATSTSVGYISLKEKIGKYGGGRVVRVKHDGKTLLQYKGVDDMLEDFDSMEEEGTLQGWCQEGLLLWYAKIPTTSVSLLVLCYRNPDPLSNQNKELDWLPDHCAYKILVGGACAYIFDEKEEEDSGKPVTRRYEAMYRDGVVDFKQWIGKNRTAMSYSTWSY